MKYSWLISIGGTLFLIQSVERRLSSERIAKMWHNVKSSEIDVLSRDLWLGHSQCKAHNIEVRFYPVNGL